MMFIEWSQNNICIIKEQNHDINLDLSHSGGKNHVDPDDWWPIFLKLKGPLEASKSTQNPEFQNIWTKNDHFRAKKSQRELKVPAPYVAIRSAWEVTEISGFLVRVSVLQLVAV